MKCDLAKFIEEELISVTVSLRSWTILHFQERTVHSFMNALLAHGVHTPDKQEVAGSAFFFCFSTVY